MLKKRKTHREMSLTEATNILTRAYIPGLIVHAGFQSGRLLGRIKVLHEDHIPNDLENAIIACNHPSVIDPFLAAGLISTHFVRHPLKCAPLIMADRQNFYNNKWLWPFKPVMMPIDRQKQDDQTSGLNKMSRIKRPRIIFPEGGRTFKGEPGQWLYCSRGNNTNGGRIRPFHGGVGILAKNSSFVLPVAILGSHKVVPNSQHTLWTYFDFWAKVTIIVGKPMTFNRKVERGYVTQQIQMAILNLLNEAL